MNNLVGKNLQIGEVAVSVREKIGEGGYALVYRAEDQQGNQYALKHVNCLTPERYEQFIQEAKILTTLPDHPHIVKLHSYTSNPKTYVLFLLYEYCPATAIGILLKREMTKEEILIFFAACSDATAFLHKQNPPIIHRDLKPENLLVAVDGTVKLCDFGSATHTIYQIKKVDEINAASEDIERNTTQNYRAPEMIDLYKRIPIGPAADVWALGCTLYKLIYRDDLYKPDERLPILQGKLRLPDDCDELFAEIIKKCIIVDPTKRATAEQLAGTAKILCGNNKTIQIPKPVHSSPSPSQQGEPGSSEQRQQQQQQGDWKWGNPLKFVQEQYRTWVATGSQKWAIKATFASSDPPASKYVRRVVLAAVRHTEMPSHELAKFLLTDRPWQTDSRISAKSLYLILLLSQYEQNLDAFNPLTVNTDQVMAFFQQNPSDQPQSKIMRITINYLGSILRTKIMLHAAHKELEGNLAFGNKKLSDSIQKDLTTYLSTIAKATKSLIDAGLAAKDFSTIVMCQPAVVEVVNAMRLLVFLSKSEANNEAFSHGNTVLETAKKIPYLQTSVIFPDFNQPPSPPPQRFVNQH